MCQKGDRCETIGYIRVNGIEGSILGNRFVAVLVGFAIMFPLDRWWSAPWYVYLPLGVIGYGLVRYAGYFVRERQYFNRTMAEVDEAVRRERGDGQHHT
jgi:hypothetical protein